MSNRNGANMKKSSLKRHIVGMDSYEPQVSKRKVLLNKNIMNSKKSLRHYSENKNFEEYSNVYKSRAEHNSSGSECDLTSVMTRSAVRKYRKVGAIHNKVNFKEELKIRKRWSPLVSYPLPELIYDHQNLKDAVSQSFTEVMSFCKCALTLERENSVKKQRELEDFWELGGKTTSFIDLSPYLTQEPIIINGKDETQITLYLDESLIPQKYIDIIPFNENGNGTLMIQEEEEDYEMINLNLKDRYLLENKYFSGSNSLCSNVSGNNLMNFLPHNPIMTVHHDHTYAQKYINPIPMSLPQYKVNVARVSEDVKDFKLENALKDLLMNTAMLKCIICGNDPKEVISCIESAKRDISDVPFVC